MALTQHRLQGWQAGGLNGVSRWMSTSSWHPARGGRFQRGIHDHPIASNNDTSRLSRSKYQGGESLLIRLLL